jgi:hypothetical protein
MIPAETMKTMKTMVRHSPPNGLPNLTHHQLIQRRKAYVRARGRGKGGEWRTIVIIVFIVFRHITG